MSLENSNPNDSEKLDIQSTEVAEIVIDDNPSIRKQLALDVVITKIGMGKFQKRLLVR
jgi:hypothetical protein